MTRISVSADAADLARSVAHDFVALLAAAQTEGREPIVALTGGTIAREIYRAVAATESSVDWSRVTFWWGDERYVAADSEERNDREAIADFLAPLGVPADRIRSAPATDSGLDLDEAAAQYGADLRAEGAGQFDLVLLGMGPDGHVASLFPGHPALDVTDAITVGVPDSPKPPPPRISLTFEALNRSRATWVLVSGEPKADAVARALAPTGSVHDTPARGIRPTGDPADPDHAPGPDALVWYLDDPAASRL